MVTFVSNERSVSDALGKEDEPKCEGQSSLIFAQKSSHDKVLGVIWNTKEDSLGYNILLQNSPLVTKRSILSSVASIYDPLGLSGPALLDGKRLFQETCRVKLGWDEPLPGEIEQRWNQWIKNVNNLSCYSIPRCMKNSLSCLSVELHVFCDGSEVAYGTVAYFKFIYEFHNDTALVASKSRLTILILELLRRKNRF